MIKIFAKKGTDEKVAMVCPAGDTRNVMIELGNTYGGDWLVVENLKFDEHIKFNDGDIYRGFDNRAGRYSKAIGKIL